MLRVSPFTRKVCLNLGTEKTNDAKLNCSFNLNNQLQQDTVSFSKRHRHHGRKFEYQENRPQVSQPQQNPVFNENEAKVKLPSVYKNKLKERLVSTPNADFDSQLQRVEGLVSFPEAKKRVSSLSRYLKEDMVGFIHPNDNKEWFGLALKFFVKASKKNVHVNEYKDEAKKLFGLLATHDNYWKSNEFANYLSGLEPNDAVLATIQAVKELEKGKTDVTFGYKSCLKKMDVLLNDGCAYTNEPMVANSHDPRKTPSAEHIMPHSWGGASSDYNYLVASAKSNNARGNIGLVDYLKGAHA